MELKSVSGGSVVVWRVRGCLVSFTELEAVSREGSLGSVGGEEGLAEQSSRFSLVQSGKSRETELESELTGRNRSW